MDFWHYCNPRLKSENTSEEERGRSAFACDNPVSIMELNSSVVIESRVIGSFGNDSEKRILLYND